MQPAKLWAVIDRPYIGSSLSELAVPRLRRWGGDFALDQRSIHTMYDRPRFL